MRPYYSHVAKECGHKAHWTDCDACLRFVLRLIEEKSQKTASATRMKEINYMAREALR